jgi:hypothetical protein
LAAAAFDDREADAVVKEEVLDEAVAARHSGEQAYLERMQQDDEHDKDEDEEDSMDEKKDFKPVMKLSYTGESTSSSVSPLPASEVHEVGSRFLDFFPSTGAHRRTMATIAEDVKTTGATTIHLFPLNVPGYRIGILRSIKHNCFLNDCRYQRRNTARAKLKTWGDGIDRLVGYSRNRCRQYAQRHTDSSVKFKEWWHGGQHLRYLSAQPAGQHGTTDRNPPSYTALS